MCAPRLLLPVAVAGTLATCLVALLASGGAPPTGLPAGLADPGPVVGWGLRLVRPLGLVAGVLTVGSLLVAAVLVPKDSSDPELRRRCLESGRRSAAVWSLTGVLGYVLSVCDVAGVPPTSLRAEQLLPWTASSTSTAHLALALGAGVVAAAGGRGLSTARAWGLLAVALAAALPVPAVGHTGTAADGGSSLSGLLVHVVAACVWIGGLAGLLMHLRRRPAALAVAAPRFSVLALGAYVVLAGSGLVAVSDALPLWGPGWASAWSSGYAGVVLVKVSILVLLGAAGAQHRRRTLPRVVEGDSVAFTRLAVAELLLMGVAAGLATALARTPVPPGPLATAGHGGPPSVDELSLVALVAAWRPNAVVLVLVGVLLAAYLRAAARVSHGAGPGGWPRRRSLWFAAGCAVAVVTLCSGVASYSEVLVSLHVAQLLIVLLVVPAMLLLGRPAQLARRAHGLALPAAVRRLLEHPATGPVATFALLTGLYRTPLVELTLRSPWWHLLVLLLAVPCGLLLLWPVLRDDPSTRRERAWEPAFWLVATAASLGLLAVQLGTGDRLLAAAWFAELRLGWSEPVADQRLAAVMVAGAAAALLVLAAGVLTRHRVSRTRPSRSSAPSGP